MTNNNNFRDHIRRAAMTLLLAVLAATTAWAQHQPVGDVVYCHVYLYAEGLISLMGWAYDPDAPSTSISVRYEVYTDQECQNQNLFTSENWTTTNPISNIPELEGNYYSHGFNGTIYDLTVGTTYWIKVFAIDATGDGEVQIGTTQEITVIPCVEYGLKVGDIEVTSLNRDDIYQDRIRGYLSSFPSREPTASYDPDTHTLTLNEPDDENCYYSIFDGDNAAIESYLENLTITGSWHMKPSWASLFEKKFVIYTSPDCSLTFDGDFTILAEGEDYIHCPIFCGGNVTIKSDSRMTVSNEKWVALWCSGTLTMENGVDYLEMHSKGNIVLVGALSLGDQLTIVEPVGGKVFGTNICTAEGDPTDHIVIEDLNYSLPATFTVNVTETTATVSWPDPVTTFHYSGYAYRFKKKEDANWPDEVITTENSVTFRGLRSNTDYEFRLRVLYDEERKSYASKSFNTPMVLPYEMGFEEGLDRWKMVNCYFDYLYNDVNDTQFNGIRTRANYKGKFGFMFWSFDWCGELITYNQYLVSPEIPGTTNPLLVSFFYNCPDSYHQLFKVGYSTTTDDIGEFTWGDVIDISSMPWTKYENTFPAGTKYIAIAWIPNGYNIRLYFDDFRFEEYSAYDKPASIGITNMTETEATLAWDVPTNATGFIYQYKEETEYTWSDETKLYTNTITLNGLTPNTTYNLRVKAMYAGNHTSNFITLNFQTDGNIVDLPYSEGFENGMGGWRMSESHPDTEILYKRNTHSGSYSFRFNDAGNHQYLISPHFAGGTPIKMSVYYSGYSTSYGQFIVGYSSSKTGTITWRNEVLTSNGEEWKLYETTFPAETQYVYICCLKEGSSLFLDDISFTRPLELADDADNTTVINGVANLGGMCNVQLTGRTLFKDGDWNTLCLPFAMTSAQIATSPLAGSILMELDGSSSNLTGGTLTLNFTDATSIEAGKPYIVKWQDGVNVTINSTADWNAFAESVNGGKSYAGKTVLLGADIDVSTMAGTSEHPFSGTFEGAGHTMNVSISYGGDGAAPFRYINGATIRNVKTTGTVSGGNHSAGLVGIAQGGTNSIRDCHVAATVSTSESYVGGIVGNGTTSTTTISNCLFGGSLSASNMGILYGWGEEGGTHTVENCVAIGTYGYSSVDLLLGSGTCTVTNCWKNTTLGSQGDNSTYIYTGGTHPLISGYLGSQWTYENNDFVLTPTVNVIDTDIVNPVFESVTIDATEPKAVTFDGGSFVGQYDLFEINAGNLNEIILLGSNNTLGYSSGPRILHPFRAHFEVPVGNGNTVKAYNLSFGDEGTETGIISIDNGKLTMDNGAGAWYDMSGRKLDGKPTQKGIYIHNGSKVVIK